jgi:2-C-methyl-D-erythritol 4-phosphate cytidylyltransferase
MANYAIIPSGGVGKRINSSLPKQYLKIKGKELIAYTLEIFQKNELVDAIVIAAQPDFFELLNEIKSKYNLDKIINIVEGGAERQNSVYNALQSINAKPSDIVLVHDAARPLLSQEILTQAITAAKSFDNVVVAIKATDTLVSGNDYIEGYLDRNTTYHIQTPQISKYSILVEAMQKAFDNNFIGTDETILLHRLSNRVRIVEGSSLNFKVTNISDLDLFKIISDIKTN